MKYFCMPVYLTERTKANGCKSRKAIIQSQKNKALVVCESKVSNIHKVVKQHVSNIEAVARLVTIIVLHTAQSLAKIIPKISVWKSYC